MRGKVDRIKLMEQIKDALQWYNAVSVKAESNLKWYHAYLVFMRVPLACIKVESIISQLQDLFKCVMNTEADEVSLSKHEFNLVYNFKTYDNLLNNI